MKKLYSIFCGTLLLLSLNCFSQINYSFSASSGTYVPITRGTSPTLVSAGVTGADAPDEGYANNIPIGFSFTYNGTAYTAVHINSNGFIALGAPFVAPTANGYYINNLATGTVGVTGSTITSATRPIIAPLWDDLDLQSASNITYLVSGSAPSRVFTVQYQDAKWDYGAAGAVISFQIQLYETSNVVQFVYQQGATAVSNTSGGASIGITAATTGVNNYISLQNTSTSPTISKASETTTLSIKPANGQTYTFTPAAPVTNDIQVSKVYALGKAGRGTTSLVRAYISNLGSNAGTNVPVTITVAGANTYTNTITIGSLPAGASGFLTFPVYTHTNTGSNTITISVPADQDNTNNSAIATQEITANQLAYGEGTTPTSSVNAGTSGTIVAKFAVPYGNIISNLNVFFSVAGNSYQAVIYNNVNGLPGTALWTSAALTSTVGENIITVTTPQNISDSFYVGVIQTGAALNLSYQAESPLRTGAFYFKPSAGAWGDLAGNAANIFRTMIGLTTANPLPVEISGFKGERKEAINLLTWTTESEQNNKGFELQRSIDGVTYGTIAFVNSKADNGTSYSKLSYQYVDEKSFAGNAYYRLKQVNKDGKPTLSNIVLLKALKINNLVLSSVYPNPTKAELKLIAVAPANDKISFVITDLSGKVVIQQAAQLTAGNNNIVVNIGKLSAGNYTIKAICASGCETAVQKFVKQ